ncbi:MAG: hypothetical protein GY868_13870, partial [Deltaproteobacteria bacterium]|nr:hypothetical protein [Deltaproteobacteria bacterium]
DITDCLEAATWAPSATNQQPWEFIVATGTELEKINDLIEENFAEAMGTDDPYGDIPEQCRLRQQEIMTTLMERVQEMGGNPNDVFEQMMRFFGAPVGVYFITHKTNDYKYCLSTAAAIENFLLAARSKGLGTCWLTVTVVPQEALKQHLGIADNKELIAGVALGYPEKDSKLNNFKRTRTPLTENTTWLGF